MQHRFVKRLFVLPCIVVLLFSFIISSPKVFSAGSSVSINPNQGPAGTQTTGLGSSWTPGHAIQVTWEDQSTNLGQATVDSNGNFTVSFTIPSNAPQGSHTIYFVDATGNVGYFITQTFTVTSTPSPSPSPTPTSTVDLQTLNIQSLQPLLAGTSPTLRANIRNNGSAASGNFNIRWIADGVIADGGHFSIPAGATDTHDYIWRNLAPGQHSITFIANFDHGVAESNYNNNQATLNFTVASPTPTSTVDLQTLNIQSLQSLLAGTSPTLRANIRNNGSAASGNFNIRWIADGVIADGGHSSISAGATDTHDYIWRNLTPGQHSITFIANFDHGVAESDYKNNQVTFNFTAASPPTRHKLFVFVQGFTSSLTSSDVSGNGGYGSASDFFSAGHIEPFLHSKDPGASFLLYSYSGFTNDGKPSPYACALTTNNNIADNAVGLYSQISQYLRTHSNMDVYVVGHSLGAVVAFSFLAQMIEGRNNLLNTLPNGGALKGVFMLDGPVGGIINSGFYATVAQLIAATNPGCGQLTSLPVVKELSNLYTSAALPNFRGATASIDQEIVLLGTRINQVVATDAMQQGIVFSTIGNSNDGMWLPKSVCGLAEDFPTTQWVHEVKAGRNAQGGAVYSRSFTSPGKLTCNIQAMKSTLLNHKDVLTNKNVQNALWEMISGVAPTDLPTVM